MSDSQNAQCRSQKTLTCVKLWKIFLSHDTIFKSAKRYFLDNFKVFWGEKTLQHKTPRKPATVNREVDCLAPMFKKADVWGMAVHALVTKTQKESGQHLTGLTALEEKVDCQKIGTNWLACLLPLL